MFVCFSLLSDFSIDKQRSISPSPAFVQTFDSPKVPDKQLSFIAVEERTQFCECVRFVCSHKYEGTKEHFVVQTCDFLGYAPIICRGARRHLSTNHFLAAHYCMLIVFHSYVGQEVMDDNNHEQHHHHQSLQQPTTNQGLSLSRDTKPTRGGPHNRDVVLRSSRSSANGAANRSPPRPKVHFPTATASNSSSGDPALFQPVCYTTSGSGKPVKLQRWVAPLLYQLALHEHVFDAVRDHTEHDQWQILIGWVPSKFMGPQAPGKKANGDIMVAPTKGRDPSVYWAEYNASWSLSLSTTESIAAPPLVRHPSEHPYVFQVAHRNALAVCTRERLHTYEQLCAPNPMIRPIRVFHCPCRHCKETLDPPLSSPQSVVSPLAQSKWADVLRPVLLDLGPHITPALSLTAEASFLTERTYQARDPDPALLMALPAGCVEDLAAPWLVPRSVVPRFPYEGHEHDLDRLLQLQSDTNGIVLVAVLRILIDHLHNFYYSLVSKARMVNLIVATMDARALAVCQANRLPCFDAVAYAELEETMQEGGAERSKGMTRKVSEAMPWIKPRLAIAVLARGYGFFMTDLDLTWNRPPLKEMLSLAGDLARHCDASNRLSINSGVYFARPNVRTIRFFQNLLVFAPEENSDQTAMKLFVKYDHTWHVERLFA